MGGNNRRNHYDYGPVGKASLWKWHLCWALKDKCQPAEQLQSGSRVLKGPRAGELGLWLVTLRAVKLLMLLGYLVFSSFFINVAVCLSGTIGSSLSISYCFMSQYLFFFFFKNTCCFLFVKFFPPHLFFPWSAQALPSLTFFSRLSYFFHWVLIEPCC